MLNKLAPAPSYVIDELAAQQGHEVVEPRLIILNSSP